jgi:F-type H+-transporting ATPase subunit delta
LTRNTHARRYSQAVFELALAEGKLDDWLDNLGKMSVITSDVNLLAWLENPKSPFEDKVRLISERLPGMSPKALNLLRLLMVKGKLGLATGIAQEYQRLLDRHRGIEQAEVVTAVPLSEEDQRKVAEKLGAMVGKKVMVKPRVDPALLGGIVARINGKLLDASARTRLEMLKNELAGAGKR